MPTINKQSHYNKVKAKEHINNNTSAIYYQSKQWKNLRSWYIRRHPLCECCLSKGIVKSAIDIHHVHPFMSATTEVGKWNLLLNEDNLMALCKDCHIEAHRHLKNPQKYPKNPCESLTPFDTQ